jgi:hypothetical protein
METGLLEETEAVGGVGRGRVGRGGSGLTGLESLPVQVALIFLFFFQFVRGLRWHLAGWQLGDRDTLPSFSQLIGIGI